MEIFLFKKELGSEPDSSTHLVTPCQIAPPKTQGSHATATSGTASEHYNTSQHWWPDNKPKKTWSQKNQEIRSFQNSQAFPENSKLLKIYTLKWWLKDYLLLHFPFEIISFHGLLGRGLPPAGSTPSPHASCGLHASLWHDRCSSPVLPEGKNGRPYAYRPFFVPRNGWNHAKQSWL